ncbi:MAG: hypothetical protein K6F64_03055 [Clostridia bacterium]|nr:hypothetical protein [Clostridia bacterium]
MNFNKQKDIDVLNMFWYIVEHWRILVVFCLIFAFIVPGVSYLNRKKSDDEINKIHADPDNIVQSTISSLNLTDDEVNEVNDLVDFAVQNKKSEEHLRGSIIFDVDPYNELIYNTEYYIRLTDIPEISSSDSVTDNNTVVTTYIRNLVVLYQNNLLSNDSIDDIIRSSEVDITPQDLQWLLRIEMGNASAGSEGLFILKLIYVDGMDVEALYKSIDKVMKKQCEESQYIAAHELIKGGTISQTIRDEQFASIQSGLLSYTKNKELELNKLVAGLSSDQASYYDLIHEIRIPTDIKPNSFKKLFVLVGAFAGVLAGCVFLAVKYLISGKLVDYAAFADNNGCTLLIDLEGRKKKKVFGFIDNLISKIRNINGINLSSEEKVKMAASRIAIACKERNVENVTFVSSLYGLKNKPDVEMVNSLISALNSKDINAAMCENVFNNPDELEKLSGSAGLIMFEKENTSRMKQIYELLSITDDLKADTICMLSV